MFVLQNQKSTNVIYQNKLPIPSKNQAISWVENQHIVCVDDF
jgi:hypothetical protein